MSGIENNYFEGKLESSFPFQNMEQSYFYEFGFGEDIRENVTMTFDSKGNLIEKKLTGSDYPSIDIVKYTYDNNNRIKLEEYYIDGKLISQTEYNYDDGLIISSKSLNSSVITYYFYEFY